MPTEIEISRASRTLCFGGVFSQCWAKCLGVDSNITIHVPSTNIFSLSTFFLLPSAWVSQWFLFLYFVILGTSAVQRTVHCGAFFSELSQVCFQKNAYVYQTSIRMQGHPMRVLGKQTEDGAGIWAFVTCSGFQRHKKTNMFLKHAKQLNCYISYYLDSTLLFRISFWLILCREST